MVLPYEGLMRGSSSLSPFHSLCGQSSASVLCNVVIGRCHQVLAFAGSTVRSVTSTLSCLSSTAQLILLLLPVPESIMRYLFLKKNMTGHGLCKSHVLLKSGTHSCNICEVTAKHLTISVMPCRASSIFVPVGAPNSIGKNGQPLCW